MGPAPTCPRVRARHVRQDNAELARVPPSWLAPDSYKDQANLQPLGATCRSETGGWRHHLLSRRLRMISSPGLPVGHVTGRWRRPDRHGSVKLPLLRGRWPERGGGRWGTESLGGIGFGKFWRRADGHFRGKVGPPLAGVLRLPRGTHLPQLCGAHSLPPPRVEATSFFFLLIKHTGIFFAASTKLSFQQEANSESFAN